MKQILILLLGSFALNQVAFAQRVALSTADSSLPMSYAVRVLKKALVKKGCSEVETGVDFRVTMRLDTGRLGDEAYSCRVAW